MAIKLSDPQTFRPVVTVVVVVIVPFFVAIIIATWSELGGAARDVVDVVRGRRGQSSAVSIHMHACALVDSYLYSCMHADPYKHMQAAYLDYFNQLRMASVDRRLDFLVC